MKHLNTYNDYLNEKKPAGAPDWHDSDAPDANGRFRDLSPKDLAAWLIKTRKKDLKRISGSLTQQVVFNRNEDPEYAEKMERTRKEVYKQLGREDLLKESINERDTLAELHDMALGQLERIGDYANMIADRMRSGQDLESWMFSQLTVALDNLNAVHDAMDGVDGIQEGMIKVDIKRIMTKIMGAIGYKHDPKMRQELLVAFEEDLKAIMAKYDYVVEADKKPGPDAYMTGLDDETEEKKKEMMKKQAEMDDDDPDAYKELPGDKEAREKGKVKTSKHVKSYHELYGDDKNEALSDYEEDDDADYDELYKNYPYKGKKKHRKNESVVSESIRVGKVVAIKKYNPKTNRYEMMDVTVTDYIKRPGSKDFVEYELKGKKKKMAFKLFKSLMESTVNEASQEAYTLSRLAKGIGQDEAEDFLSNNKIYLAKVKRGLDAKKFTAYDLRDVIQDKASKSIEKKVMDYITESVVNEELNAAQQKRLKAFFDKLSDETLYDICDDLYHGMDMSYGQSAEYKKWERAKKNATRKRLITLAMKASIANNLSITHFRDEVGITESVNEEKAKGDRGPIDNKGIETGLKNKSKETGVPIEFLRIIMRRGMAAWKTGHRPGAGQEQWGYARVNSFLTKQPGTWGGADKDVAKEVRDGGHDKKLKKA